MKTVFKQLGKAICYVMLFVGVQLFIGFAFQFFYGFKVGIEAGLTGIMPDEQTLYNELVDFIVKNTTWMSLISGVVTLLVLWLFFVIRKKKLLKEAQIHKFDKRMILPIILFGVALSFVISSVLVLLPIPESIMTDYMEKSVGILYGPFLVRVLAIVILAPIVEEVIFRGLVLSRLKVIMKPWLAIGISSLAFAVMHGQLLWIAYAFVLGIILAIVAESTKSIGSTILLHVAFNSVSLFAENIDLSTIQTIIVGFISLAIVLVSGYYIVIGNNKKVAMCDTESV